ncbi:MAG: hypothetical protein HYY14_02915 [Candidatus Omnitrophica bacterium]|nr:hypothetical protein [Candidatus Omnitrophota bacterium]
MTKNKLVTMRFLPQELKEIQSYLRKNPLFTSISSLGRAATMEFIHTRREVALFPQGGFKEKERPSFLWDYDLTEAQVREILRHSPFEERKWLIARILDRLGPPEIFSYLSVSEIKRALPELRMDPKVKRHWQEAVDLWTAKSRKS